MAVDYFIKFDGIKGESTDAKHKDEVDVESWSWGETQTAERHPGGGGGVGRVSMQDFQFVMRLNRASPPYARLRDRAAHQVGNAHRPQGRGKSQAEYLTFKLTDVLVSSYQTGGSEHADVPIDQVSLNFAKIQVEYRAQRPDGTLDAPVTFAWPTGKAHSAPRRGRLAVEPSRAVPAPRRPDPPRTESRSAAVELARLLRTAGYASRPIQERLERPTSSLRPHPSSRLTSDGSVTETSWRCSTALPARSARPTCAPRAARRPELRARLAGAGLLLEDRDDVFGTARLVPHDELLVASDHAGTRDVHADHVPGVHRPSVALAHLTVRAGGERSTWAPATGSRRSFLPRTRGTSWRRT